MDSIVEEDDQGLEETITMVPRWLRGSQQKEVEEEEADGYGNLSLSNTRPPCDVQESDRALGDSNISLVIQKSHFQIDVSFSHNHLAVTLNHIQQKFLTCEENERLNSERKEKKCTNMEVTLIEPSLH